MARGKDREMLRTAIASKYGLTEEDLKGFVTALKFALKLSCEAKHVRDINSCLNTATRMVQQMQADEHALIRIEPPPAQQHQHVHVHYHEPEIPK